MDILLPILTECGEHEEEETQMTNEKKSLLTDTRWFVQG